MLKNLVRSAAIGALALAVPAAAQAAAPASLPTVTRTVSAASAATTYTAPISGYVTARLSAPRGDWDIEVVARVSDFDEYRAEAEVPIR